MRPPRFKSGVLISVLSGVVALALLAAWLASRPRRPQLERVPGTDKAPGSELGSRGNAVLAGKLVVSQKAPYLSSGSSGAWPGFRGKDRNGISPDSKHLARSWDNSGLRQIWSIDVGDGYAGAAVLNGRVYLMDYDRERKQDALRCLSVEDGGELWRFAYPVSIKRNHGMSRTVPAVTEHYVVGIGPKCHVVCLDAISGELKWGMDMVKQYGATVPPWYAGQNPLIEGDTVILAPGGQQALLMAVQVESGKVLWQTANPHGWKMTHSSIMPMQVDGERMYVYCANGGVVGVSAKDGSLMWETSAWKISIATVPSPLVLNEGRIFLSGGYNAGSLMLQVKRVQGRWKADTVFKLEPEVFGATQHTPILFEEHIYGPRADGRFTCLDLQGKPVWTSDAGHQFGLGSFLMGDGGIFALNDSGLLRLIQATPQKYNLLAQAQILQGHESWGPLALADGRLFARDLTRLVCLDVAQH
jgi:outer membrane protein assembly factor BamB